MHDYLFLSYGYNSHYSLGSRYATSLHVIELRHARYEPQNAESPSIRNEHRSRISHFNVRLAQKICLATNEEKRHMKSFLTQKPRSGRPKVRTG